MTGVHYGTISYPGVNAIESLSITDISGIAPSVATLTMYPQATLPDSDGDLVLTYDDNAITFPNMHIDAMHYSQGSGGKMVTLRLIDERWTWADATVTLRANIRLPNNFVNPYFEVTPQQLAAYCFDALGVALYDVSALPNDARPDIDWDHANPAQVLAKMCDELGCRITPVRSTGTWTIVVTGVGASLPDDIPYNDRGDGIDPKEIPDFIRIVTAPILYQCALPLEALGQETDLSYQLLSQLSYRPTENANFVRLPEMTVDGFYPKGHFENVSRNRFYLDDGTQVSAFELATRSCFKTWRIQDKQPFGQFNSQSYNAAGKIISQRPNQGTISVPGYPDPVFRKQIIPTNTLVQSWVDVYGEPHRQPAFVFGNFRGDHAPNVGATGTAANYPGLRRIDQQVNNYDARSLEDISSFSMSIDPVDTDKTIITTSDYMYRISKQTLVSGKLTSTWDAALLWIMAAVQVRDLQTWQPRRTEYLFPVGSGGNTDFCMTVEKNDIQPYFIQNYSFQTSKQIASQAPGLVLKDLIDNSDDVENQCLFYAQQIAQTFYVLSTSTRTYYGFFPIDMDGAIQQVTYKFSKSGFDTIASLNNEHSFDTPKYQERRMRDARNSPDATNSLIKEITARQDKIKVTYTT